MENGAVAVLHMCYEKHDAATEGMMIKNVEKLISDDAADRPLLFGR